MAYSHLLVAVGPGEDAEQLLARAAALAQKLGARLTLLHVVDAMAPVAGMLAGPAFGTDPLALTDQVALTDTLLTAQRERVEALCTKLGVKPDEIRVSAGAQAAEILAVAEETGADLIVVGHQAHRGLASWFSHTDESVVHRATRDVLALALEPKPAA